MKKFTFLTIACLLLVGFGCTTKAPDIDTSNVSDQEKVTDQIDEAPAIDSDGDRITDYDEIEIYQTDPNNADTDGDGYSDGEEIAQGYDPNEPAVTTIVEENVTESSEDGSMTVRFSETITTMTCGADKSCFDEKFAACEPATMTYEGDDWIGVKYEITGPSGDGCAVTMLFTINPNPDWEDKPAYCVVDNTKTLEDAFEEAMNASINGLTGPCSGPLMDLMNQ